MLRLIPAPAHRAALRLAHALRKRWWRIRRTSLTGCRVIAIDSQSRVLLIRHSYGSGSWMPPGGGIGRGESPLAAAARELGEETGCLLESAMQVALIEENLHGARNAVHVIAGRTESTPRPDLREVIAAEFFALPALPLRMPEPIRAQLPEWVRTAAAGFPPHDRALPPSPPPAPKA